jgi:hypothetical protein
MSFCDRHYKCCPQFETIASGGASVGTTARLCDMAIFMMTDLVVSFVLPHRRRTVLGSMSVPSFSCPMVASGDGRFVAMTSLAPRGGKCKHRWSVVCSGSLVLPRIAEGRHVCRAEKTAYIPLLRPPTFGLHSGRASPLSLTEVRVIFRLVFFP